MANTLNGDGSISGLTATGISAVQNVPATSVITTLNAPSGVLATQNGMTGIPKAWVNFNGTGTVAIRASFNVSSITDNGTGNYTVNLTTAMPNANSCVQVSTNTNVTNADVSNNIGSINATTINIVHIEGATTADTPIVCVAVFNS